MLKSIRDRTRAWSAARDFHVVILGPICCYKTDIRFMLNFVLIYAVLAHVLRRNPLTQNPRTMGCTRFWRHNFGPRLLLQNIYRIYAKFRTHLRCFSSRFTLESARTRTSTRSGACGYIWLGLPILMEAQGFHYLVPIYIYESHDLFVP
jgi:hypothetical protein